MESLQRWLTKPVSATDAGAIVFGLIAALVFGCAVLVVCLASVYKS